MERTRLNVKEGATFLGISVHMVRYLIRTGQLACYRIGRRIVLDRQDLDRFLASHRVAAVELTE